MSDLIKFIKSIIKWIILFLVLVALIVGAVIAYKYNNDRLVTMFAMTCSYYENSTDNNDDLFVAKYYLIKKRNNSELPYSIYRGIHLLDDIGKTKEKIFEQSRLESATADEYIFNTIGKNSTFKLNRKNLSLEFKGYSTSGAYKSKANCILISEKEFYSAIENIINKKFEGNKI